MHIFLYGPPGTGKSTIGKLIARSLKLPFVDLDRVIEEDTDMPISEIMERRRESAFRDLEAAALNETMGHALSVTGSQDKVIALGGGALLRDDNRKLAESNGKVILLIAELNTLVERLGEDPNQRPLLAGSLETKLAALLDKRREHYASFELILNVDNRTAEQNAHRVQVMLGRHHLSAMGEYDVIVGQASSLANFPMQNPTIVTDNDVAKLHLVKVTSALQAAGHPANTVILPAGEENKDLELISHLWKDFIEHGLDRRSTVIALIEF